MATDPPSPEPPPHPHSTTTDQDMLPRVESVWIFKKDRMMKKDITFIPGLYRIIDEILLSLNNRVYGLALDVFDGQIRIRSDAKCFNLPESLFNKAVMINNDNAWNNRSFGNIKFMTNYLSFFRIQATDKLNRRRVFKDFTKDNVKHKTIFAAAEGCMYCTELLFIPDLEELGIESLEDDTICLLRRRMVDLAGCLGAEVMLDDSFSCIPPHTFEDYVKLYTRDSLRMYQKINDRLEFCVCSSPQGLFEQVSFVNGIATMNGGSLVDHITTQITDYLATILGFKPNDIKNRLWVFVNATVDKPVFDSPTKLKLVSYKDSFGSAFQLTPCFLDAIYAFTVGKLGLVNTLLEITDFNQNEELEETDGESERESKEELDIPELDDDYLADTAGFPDSTLILTQGEIFAEFVLSGDQRDTHGVYPLTGELLNAREASPDTNADFQNIMKILGLRHGEIYENVDNLRYKRLMIMAHRNHRGSRIIGLLINFLHFYWPSLLKVPNFLWTLITPIVKASNKKNEEEVLRFYTMPAYEAWKKNLGNDATEYAIKYYEGLPNLSESEIEGCLADTDHKNKVFFWDDDFDVDSMELAFSKQKIMDRKDWILASKPGSFVDLSGTSIRYHDFIRLDFRQYLVADLQISIPSMVDGLKAYQRNILFCAFKEPITQEIDVAQFSDYVFARSAHHHGVAGEESLVSTIVGMAQNYVGSNNINLLQPDGLFGTRRMGGNDHASGEYLFTHLSPITRYLFHEDDELVLKYLEDGGQTIGPTWFIPIIPMVLVNGCEETGCAGLSSFIPNYKPQDIIRNLKRLLNGEAMVPMLPWYKGFKGDIQKTASEDTQYTTTGNYEVIEGENALSITELPVRIWTRDYKEFLEAALQDGKDKTPFIKSYTTVSEGKTVHIKICMTQDQMKTAEQEGFHKKFKLTNTLSTANMNLFDSNGVFKKYDTPEKILEEFYYLRLKFYGKRRDALIQELDKAVWILKNKRRFISLVCRKKICLIDRKIRDLCKDLEDLRFRALPEKRGDSGTEYDYLLSVGSALMTTDEKKDELRHELTRKKQKLDALTKTLPKDLWLADLAALEQQLKNQDRRDGVGDSDEEKRKLGVSRRKRKRQDKDLDHKGRRRCEAPKNKAPAKQAASGPQRAKKMVFGE